MNWTHLLGRWGRALAALGQLRHHLVVEAPQSSADGAGGITQTFAVFVTVWAGIRPVLATPANSPQQTGETVTHHIVIRYRTDIRIGMRFRQGSERYLIRQMVDPDGTKCRLVCMCTQERG